MSKRNFTHFKGRRSSQGRGGASHRASEVDESLEGIKLTDLRATTADVLLRERDELHSPFMSKGIVFDMMVEGDRKQLAIALFTSDYKDSLVLLREANQALVTVLRAQMSNTSRETEHSIMNTEHYIDGVLVDLCRAQNIHRVPLITAAQSLLGECNHLAREYHDGLAMYHRGAAMSEKWVADFMKDACKWRPDAVEIMLSGVVITVFDNLSMKINYGSYSSEGETGSQLHMTNWLSTRVEAKLAPTMDAKAICVWRARSFHHAQPHTAAHP